MKKCILLLCPVAIPFLLQAQVVLFVSPGTNLSVKPSTLFYSGGLTLVPSSTFVITNNSLQKNTSLTHWSANPAITRTYNFGNVTAPFTGYIQLDYNTGELNGIPEALLQPNINNGTGWQAYPSSTIDNVNHYVVSAGLSGTTLSEITLGNVSTPLSATWGDISARRSGQMNIISWSTEGESGIDHFAVEYSSDGKTWQMAVPQIAPYNRPAARRYTQTDPVYRPEFVLYRVSETDLDGKVSYSSVAALAAVAQPATISVYPNPVTDRFTISLPLNEVVASVDLLGSNGVAVKHWSSAQNAYSVSGLAKGIYIVLVKSNSGLSQNIRLIIR